MRSHARLGVKEKERSTLHMVKDSGWAWLKRRPALALSERQLRGRKIRE